MLLSEVLKANQIYVSYFQQGFGEVPNHIANIGVFSNIRSAEQACKQYFRNNVLAQLRNDTIQSYEQGDMSDDDLNDALEMIDMDVSDSGQWSFQEYIHNGQKLWDMGSGEYAFAGKLGGFPTAQDLSL